MLMRRRSDLHLELVQESKRRNASLHMLRREERASVREHNPQNRQQEQEQLWDAGPLLAPFGKLSGNFWHMLSPTVVVTTQVWNAGKPK